MESTTVKLQTSAKHKHGHKNVIPYIGETQIGTDGIIEVKDMETATKVCTAVPDFTIIGDLQKKAEENTLGKEGAGALTTKTEEETKDLEKDKTNDPGNTEDKDKKDGEPAMSVEDATGLLKDKTLVQLQQFAQSSNLPTTEWEGLQKPKLKEYIIGKLTAPVQA